MLLTIIYVYDKIYQLVELFCLNIFSEFASLQLEFDIRFWQFALIFTISCYLLCENLRLLKTKLFQLGIQENIEMKEVNE